MPFCRNERFTIDMKRDSDNLLLDRLFFHLIFDNGTVSGEVRLSTGPPLSEVTGSSQSFSDPDVCFVNVTFLWGRVSVFLVGLIYFRNNGGGRIEFIGRFGAVGGSKERTFREPVLAPPLLPVPPADGDTGTASGTQT